VQLTNMSTAMVKETKHLDSLTSHCTDARGTYIWTNLEILRQAREAALQEYKAVWAETRGNKTCLACLQAVPDHVLECSHNFYAQCVQEFGKSSLYFEYCWTMDKCILCLRSWRNSGPTFRLHPRCAGVRALTLDGGGIRGIIELTLLEKLDAAVGLEIPVRDLFDIIVGANTGEAKSIQLFHLKTLSGLPSNTEKQTVVGQVFCESFQSCVLMANYPQIYTGGIISLGLATQEEL
jgi:hypothetical protein